MKTCRLCGKARQAPKGSARDVAELCLACWLEGGSFNASR